MPPEHSDTHEKNEQRGSGREPPTCFVMMPITDPPGYESGHFRRVFEDIFTPACEKAGYRALRADQVRHTNLIHVDVLQKVIRSPMALCDLSSRNPNVLFELGLRVAFDKPVLLVRDIGTLDLFDIAPLRYTEYRRDRVYHQVIEDQEAISAAIRDTYEAAQNGEQCANSVVQLLSLPEPACEPPAPEDSTAAMLRKISMQIESLQEQLRTRSVAWSDEEYLARAVAVANQQPDGNPPHEESGSSVKVR